MKTLICYESECAGNPIRLAVQVFNNHEIYAIVENFLNENNCSCDADVLADNVSDLLHDGYQWFFERFLFSIVEC